MSEEVKAVSPRMTAVLRLEEEAKRLSYAAIRDEQEPTASTGKYVALGLKSVRVALAEVAEQLKEPK